MEWILAHWETLAAIVAFVVAAVKAKKNGTVAAFLVSKVEGLASPEDRKAIGADALKAKVEGTLAPLVRKVTKGEGGGMLGLLKGLLPVLALVALSGCATGEAGRSQAPASGITIEAREGSTVTVNITGDANGRGMAAPESEATQTATTSVTPTVTVPEGAVPR